MNTKQINQLKTRITLLEQAGHVELLARARAQLTMLDSIATPQLPGPFAPTPPAHWVDPVVSADFARMDLWPLSLYCEQTGQWVDFENVVDLQAATLVDQRAPLPESPGWRGGR